jgi:nucleoside 2-deoxyribosyltransferase
VKIYVASSWRNPRQPDVVTALRAIGHNVYDFRHPAPGATGFAWSEIDPEWQSWTAEAYREALDHVLAEEGFRRDMDALRGCDACLLVLPSGRSAHLEAGWAAGAGKHVAVLTNDGEEPELMAKMAGAVLVDLQEVLAWAARTAQDPWIVDDEPEPCTHLLVIDHPESDTYECETCGAVIQTFDFPPDLI